jgi:hypothetical protein
MIGQLIFLVCADLRQKPLKGPHHLEMPKVEPLCLKPNLSGLRIKEALAIDLNAYLPYTQGSLDQFN